MTAEDVKFSFERYRGAAHELMKDQVAAVETPDPQHVRFKLKEPWPDFLTFYASASGAGWIVPKKYVEKVGDDGFKKAPIGAGPYKFVSFTPGVELVLEAFEGYWRKTPSVKRLVLKVIPDEATRLAALKRGEVDIAYSIRGELAEELRRTPGLTLKPVVLQAPNLALFSRAVGPEIALARSAGAAGRQSRDRPRRHEPGAVPRLLQDHQQHHSRHLRVLLAAAGAGLRSGQGQEAAGRGGLSQRLRRRRLLLRQLVREHGRGGRSTILQQVGIRAQAAAARARRLLRRLRAARNYTRGIIQGASGAFGNAATRLEAFVVKGGAYAYGSYPDIDALFRSRPTSSTTRSARRSSHKMQQLVHEQGDLRADLAARPSSTASARGSGSRRSA